VAKLLSSSNEYDFVDRSNLGSARFIITVDTEEEFNWSAPFSREQRSVAHLAKADRFQNLCAEFGVKPIYLIDHPVASDASAIKILGDFVAQGKATIGMHLHPWVNPPFVEEVNARNSYSCNLSPDLEREKLEILYNCIQSNFGIAPNIYRAGRYGVGSNTINILQNLDIQFDTSVRACFDYSADSGPNFALEPDQAYWLKRDALMELPVTTVFGGKMRQFGKVGFNSVFGSNIARGVLAKTGMLERIAFTPEGIPVNKMLEGIELALQSGIGILNFSFHSPSLAPGFTPYVRNDADLESFYNWWRIVFEFMQNRGVRPVSLDQLSEALMSAKANMPDLALARTGNDPLSARQ
jgi:hypothetical protein